MTHEQKPESAEFRTRAEHIVMIMCEAEYSDIVREKGLEELFGTILAEAEARGAAEQRRKSEIEAEDENARFADADEESTLKALMRRHGIDREDASEELNWWQERDKRFPLNKAEQRRKDAEGAEARTCPNCGGSGEEPGAYYSDGSSYSCSVCEGSGAIYARPANVTALEERVRELEGVLSYLKDEALRFASFYPSGNDARNTFVLFAGMIADRAAAIREGGEHG